MPKLMNRNLLSMLMLCALAMAASTGCIVISEGGDGHHGGERGDHYSDWDDDDFDWDKCGCEDWDGECGEGGHEGHDHEDHDGEDGQDMTPPVVEPGGETPGVCPQPEQVCGDDAVTYETACAASRARVRVQHVGPCGEACLFDADCGVYEQCGSAGTCEPVSCTAEVAPVCGVDGVTYSNACEAGAHHVGVASQGECAPACQVDADCELGSVCEGGSCEEAACPEIAEGDFSQEICGEDDFTYASACHARAEHISVAHQGCCVE